MASNNMSNNRKYEEGTPAELDSETIQEDTLAASINFYYDGLTGVPKFSVKREDPHFIDPLSVYAIASMAVLEEHYDEIVAKMEEITDMSQTALRVH